MDFEQHGTAVEEMTLLAAVRDTREGRCVMPPPASHPSSEPPATCSLSRSTTNGLFRSLTLQAWAGPTGTISRVKRLR